MGWGHYKPAVQVPSICGSRPPKNDPQGLGVLKTQIVGKGTRRFTVTYVPAECKACLHRLGEDGSEPPHVVNPKLQRTRRVTKPKP